LAYSAECAIRYGLLPHCRFDAEVQRVAYDDRAGTWTLACANGSTVEADFVVAGVGQLNRPATPDFPGLGSFRGPQFHSARWDHGVDAADRQADVVDYRAQRLGRCADQCEIVSGNRRERNNAASLQGYGTPLLQLVDDVISWLERLKQADGRLARAAHVPEAIRFKTKPQIALAQLRAALVACVAPGVVLMDASYGTNSALRAGIGALALTYVAAILPTVKVRAVADPDERVSAKELALGLPKHAWRTITWRDGSADPLRSRFARVRVRTAPIRDAAARPEETLLIEWPHGEAAPTKYWLSNVAKTISFRELVDIAKMRWRIERDYQDLKQEIGLGHYEGRGWRGFHHHGTLCIAAYGFLISERETIPPSGPRSAGMFAKPAISGGYRPRGAAAPASTAHPQLNRDRPLRNGGRNRKDAAALPMLRPQISTKHATKFMTQ
jgi:hypothetical protein